MERLPSTKENCISSEAHYRTNERVHLFEGMESDLKTASVPQENAERHQSGGERKKTRREVPPAEGDDHGSLRAKECGNRGEQGSGKEREARATEVWSEPHIEEKAD